MKTMLLILLIIIQHFQKMQVISLKINGIGFKSKLSKMLMIPIGSL